MQRQRTLFHSTSLIRNSYTPFTLPARKLQSRHLLARTTGTAGAEFTSLTLILTGCTDIHVLPPLALWEIYQSLVCQHTCNVWS